MKEFAQAYLHDLIQALNLTHFEKLRQVAENILRVRSRGGTVYLMGNGGSSATPSHSAGDWTKELGIRAICLSDNTPLLTAYANDTEYANIFKGPLETFLREGDLILAYSGSGNSPNVIRACEYARTMHVPVIGFTGNYAGKGGGKLAEIADIALVAPTLSMERIEDIHLIYNHIIKEYIKSELSSGS